jgi:hypothetical protein
MKLFLMAALLFSTSAFAHLKVNPGTIIGFDPYPDQLERIHQSFDVIEAVINSEEFRNEVISFKGKNGKGYTANNNLTNEQIYDFLMTGKELVGGENSRNEMNFDIKRHYFRWLRKSVIAETDPGRNNVIRVSEWFYWDFEVHQISGNLTHEWIHLMGFYHANANDTDSVPYAVGDIMERLSEKLLRQGYLN